MGRSQVVRQRILIPPFGGSSPPAPASQSGLHQLLPLDHRNPRDEGLFVRPGGVSVCPADRQDVFSRLITLFAGATDAFARKLQEYSIEDGY
jgi:hypothetical protein